MRALLLALLALIPPEAWQYRTGSAAPVFTAALNAAGAVPACTTADGCVLDCGVGVATGATQWECVDGAGAVVTVTQGAGTTYQLTGLGATQAPYGITDASAPRILAAAAAAAVGGSFYSNDHTIVVVGYNGTVNYGLWAHGGFTADGVYFHPSDTQLNVRWNSGAASQLVSAAIGAQNRWVVMSARRSSGNYIARANGTQTSTAIVTAVTEPTTRDMTFGRESTRAGFASNGALGRVRLYNRSLADAELTRFEAQWFGTTAGVANASVDRNSTSWCEAGDGYFYAVGDDAGCVTSRGLLAENAKTNYWTNNLDANAWLNSATPTFTGGTWSGPFSRIVGGAEGDTIGDDSAVAAEGKNTGSLALGPAQYTTSVYFKQGGTCDQLLLQLQVTGGSGSGSCTFSTINTTPACNAGGGDSCSVLPSPISGVYRATCTRTAGAGTTSILGVVYPCDQDSVADQGTVLVTAPQLEASSFASSPILTGASALQRVTVNATLPTTGWPTRAGTWKLTYTPEWSAPPNDGRLLVTRSGLNGLDWYIIQANGLGSYVGDGVSAVTRNNGTPTSWTAYQAYAMRIVWGGGSLNTWRDTTYYQLDVTGTAPMPTANLANAQLGSYPGAGSSWADGWFRNVEVYP